jgi:hypothetical protein
VYLKLKSTQDLLSILSYDSTNVIFHLNHDHEDCNVAISITPNDQTSQPSPQMQREYPNDFQGTESLDTL